MHLDYVACCSATWLKVCLQPFQSGFLPGQCARKLVVKMLFGHLLIVRMFFVHRGRGKKVPNIVYVDIVQKLFFEVVYRTFFLFVFIVSEMLY